MANYNSIELNCAPDSAMKRVLQDMLSSVGFEYKTTYLNLNSKGTVTFDTDIGPVTFLVDENGKVTSVSPYGESIDVDTRELSNGVKEAIRYWERTC